MEPCCTAQSEPVHVKLAGNLREPVRVNVAGNLRITRYVPFAMICEADR
jgi:hypothetical protein